MFTKTSTIRLLDGLMCKTSVEKTFTLMKARHQSTLNRLLNRKTKRAVAFNEEKNKKLIIKFSDKTLTECQEDVIELGLNFAPVPTKLPLIDTVTAVEAVTKFLNEDKANDLRGRVCGILRKSKQPQDNLSK